MIKEDAEKVQSSAQVFMRLPQDLKHRQFAESPDLGACCFQRYQMHGSQFQDRPGSHRVRALEGSNPDPFSFEVPGSESQTCSLSQRWTGAGLEPLWPD